jgi:hypothetical protein
MITTIRKTTYGDYYLWLVVWNMAFIFHFIYGVILPIDELIFFRGVETTNQIICPDPRTFYMFFLSSITGGYDSRT